MGLDTSEIDPGDESTWFAWRGRETRHGQRRGTASRQGLDSFAERDYVCGIPSKFRVGGQIHDEGSTYPLPLP